jgi:hypothetical protein
MDELNTIKQKLLHLHIFGVYSLAWKSSWFSIISSTYTSGSIGLKWMIKTVNYQTMKVPSFASNNYAPPFVYMALPTFS